MVQEFRKARKKTKESLATVLPTPFCISTRTSAVQKRDGLPKSAQARAATDCLHSCGDGDTQGLATTKTGHST